MVWGFLSDLATGLGDAVSDIGVGDLLTGAGYLYGATQTPENVALPQGGYAALPDYIQKFYENTYYPGLEEVAAMDYVSRPMRKAPMPGEAGFDPIFGSYGLADLQGYMNEMNMPPAVNEMPMPETPAQTMPMSLPGWNEEAQMFTTPFGATVAGDAGRRAAEAAAINADFEAAMNRAGRSMQGSGWVAPSIAMTESGRVNPYTGRTFDKEAALAGIESGNLDEVYQQAGNAAYDPTRSLFEQLVPMAALAAITGGVGMGANMLAAPGMIAPATAAKGFSGLTSLAQNWTQ